MTRAVEAVKRTVYRATHHRHGRQRTYFSREAAYRSAANALVYSACEEADTGGCHSCRYCGNQNDADRSERWVKLRNRLARWLRWRDERAACAASNDDAPETRAGSEGSHAGT